MAGTLLLARKLLTSALEDHIILTLRDYESIELSVTTRKAVYRSFSEESIEKLRGYFADPSETDNHHKIDAKEEESSLSLKVKTNGKISRILWSVELEKDEDQTPFDTACFLIDTQGQIKDESTSNDEEIRDKEAISSAWKETAERLEGVWQTEKSKLLENFVNLYHQKHELTKSLEERVEQLEEDLKQAHADLAEAVADQARNSKPARDTTEVQVPVDGLDLDAAQIASLAKGEPVKQKTTRKRAAVKRKRLPPHTAIKEEKPETKDAGMEQAVEEEDVKKKPSSKPSNSKKMTLKIEPRNPYSSSEESGNIRPTNEVSTTTAPAPGHNPYDSTDDENEQSKAITHPERTTTTTPRRRLDHNPYSSSSEDEDGPLHKKTKTDEDMVAGMEDAMASMRSDIFAALKK